MSFEFPQGMTDKASNSDNNAHLSAGLNERFRLGDQDWYKKANKNTGESLPDLQIVDSQKGDNAPKSDGQGGGKPEPNKPSAPKDGRKDKDDDGDPEDPNKRLQQELDHIRREREERERSEKLNQGTDENSKMLEKNLNRQSREHLERIVGNGDKSAIDAGTQQYMSENQQALRNAQLAQEAERIGKSIQKPTPNPQQPIQEPLPYLPVPEPQPDDRVNSRRFR